MTYALPDDPHMIHMTLTGLDTVSCGSVTLKNAKNPIGAMARHLEAEGRDLRDPVTVKRGDTICFAVEPLGFWAAHTIRENDAGIRRMKYRPFNGEVFE